MLFSMSSLGIFDESCSTRLGMFCDLALNRHHHICLTCKLTNIDVRECIINSVVKINNGTLFKQLPSFPRQNWPKFSCATHVWSEICMMIDQLGLEEIDLVRTAKNLAAMLQMHGSCPEIKLRHLVST